MRVCLAKAAIIGLCLLALSGCSLLRVSYDQGPTLAWWWLDGYVDFDAEQAPRVKAALRQWFDWHRATQLTDYANLLDQAQVDVMQPSTSARMCRWADTLRESVDVAVQRALVLAAPLAPTLSTQQLDHLQRKYRESNDDFRSDFMQPDAAERLAASVKRATQRAEMLYGELNDDQLRLVAQGVAASPFDARTWFDERLALQDATLRTLRQVKGTTDNAAALMALRALATRATQPPPAYAAYSQRLRTYNCDLASRVHNSTTQAQRQFARDKLKGWGDDLRALGAQREPD